MKTTISLAALICAMWISSSEALARIPRHSNSKIECTSAFDCRHGQCCTISTDEKYSYPRCQRLHEEGDYCQAGGPMVTTGSRTFPNESQVHLEDVYLTFCPCAPGLICDSDERICRQPSDMKDFNYLKEEETGSNKNDD